ncbi:MAG: FAD-dependent oxidoreductase [Oligoflexia bacterium]|nr:FAD-dependent oxidoreductase [Oligoflexia bacterium]
MLSEFSDLEQRLAGRPFGVLNACRAEIIHEIKKRAAFDILVVGGGIHGAAFARLAALNGLSTLLLERSDYAHATSSRTSKMAHGGLRYLELFDFPQVFDGIRSREDLFVTAPHLVRPHEFFIPLFSRSCFDRLRLATGLWLYDRCVMRAERRSRYLADISQLAHNFEGSARAPQAGFIYCDGIMRDARLVQENILAARQEGALCLNHARVDSVYHVPGGRVSVGCSDVLGKEKFEVHAGIVVNCAGPWVGQVGRLSSAAFGGKLCFSQGVHLLFSKPWHGPALILPRSKRGSYYFVWPHFSGTMVGTTERELDVVPEDPQASEAEVNELLQLLARDIPGAGLSRDRMHASFAGVRTLLRSSSGKSSVEISRKPFWHFSGGVLFLIGGKFTTAYHTVFAGLRMALKLAGDQRQLTGLQGRLLPGAWNLEESFAWFKQRCDAHSIPLPIQEAAFARFGGLVKQIFVRDENFAIVDDRVLLGEVLFARHVEQAESCEDVVRRRLELHYLPNFGAINAAAFEVSA